MQRLISGAYALVYGVLGWLFALSINAHGFDKAGWIVLAAVLGGAVFRWMTSDVLYAAMLIIVGIAAANLWLGLSPFVVFVCAVAAFAVACATAEEVLHLVYDTSFGPRTATTLAFGLIGLFAAYSMNKSGVDLAMLVAAGAWLGLLLPEFGEAAVWGTGWFTAWTFAGVALADWVLHLGAWGVLFGFAGLVLGLVVGFCLIAIALAEATEGPYREKRHWGKAQVAFASAMVLCLGGSLAIFMPYITAAKTDGLELLLIAATVFCGFAAGLALLWVASRPKWVAWFVWTVSWAFVAGSIAWIDLGWSLRASMIVALIGLCVGDRVLWELGADHRREEREYHADDDDLWVAYGRRKTEDAPEAPPVIT